MKFSFGHTKKLFFLTVLLFVICASFFFYSFEQRHIGNFDFGAKKLRDGNIQATSYAELKEKFRALASEESPRIALDTLEEESNKNATTSAFCHDLLHEIGKIAYNKYGSLEGALKDSSDFCNSGYLHGVFESYFVSAANPLIGLEETCKEYSPSPTKFALWQCHHGIGHGLMYFTNGDLDASLQLCTSTVDADAVKDCQNGVFMELFNTEFLPLENSVLRAKDPFEICASRDTAKAECYNYVPAYLSQTKKQSYEDIFAACNGIDKSYKDSCIAGVATEAIKRNMNDPNSVFALCSELADRQDQISCAGSLVGMYLNQTGSLEEGGKICTAAPDVFKDLCSSVVDGSKSFFRKE